MERDRSNWTSWITRISTEDSDRLMELGKFMKEKKQISKVDKYNITRFALVSLLHTLNKKESNITKDKPNPQ